MELVEGEDLSQRIARLRAPGASARQAGMALDEALPLARQIAEALEAAHEQGIVHRDLKPANVKVRPDGTVKVLDFGLAKAIDQGSGIGDQGSGGAADSPTITTPAMTMRGMILGTAAYMSPEQARGKAVDRRADIWAFGVVLFEMLTGRRAFEGEDISVTLANVIKEEPKWALLPPATPASIRRLLRRCLEKDAKKRLSAIADARIELDEALLAGDETVAGGPQSRTRERVWMVATVAAVMAAISTAIWLWPRPVASSPPILFSLPAPDGEPYFESPRMMALSPDGRRVAFVAGSADQRRLWIRPLDSLVAQPLTGTEDAYEPAWSPDGRSLAFSVTRSSIGSTGVASLKRVDVAGGPVMTLASAAPDAPAWSPSGVILVAGADRRGLYRLSDNGGPMSSVTELDASRQETGHHSPVFLPDGRRFLFSATSSDRKKSALFLASLDAPERTLVIDIESSVGYADGYLVYQQDGVLMARPFDERRGQVTGEAVPIAESVQRDRIGRAAFSLSDDGTLLYRSILTVGVSRLTWFDSSGQVTGAIDGLARNTEAGELSPDRTKLVVTRNDGRSSDVWVIDVARGVPSRLTFDPGPDSAPAWLSNSEGVVWRSDRNGKTGIYRRALSGNGGDQLVYESSQNLFPQQVSADGKLLIFNQTAPGGWDVWAMPLTGEAKPVPVVTSRFSESFAALSPDGHWLAYGSDKAGDGSSQVYVQSYPVPNQEVRISSNGGRFARWSADGRRLYFMTQDAAILAADLAFSSGKLSAGVPVELFRRPGAVGRFAFDPVGPRFLLAVPPEGANRQDQLTAVLHWPALVKE